LDPALRWGAHLRAVEAKAVHQVNALKSLTGSTWGMSTEAALRVYTGAVRPAVIYGSNAWYRPEGTPGHRKGVAGKLQAVQGRCLRVITGAYRATSTEALKIETNTPPLDLYAGQQVAKATLRLLASHTRRAYEK
jgi:hypothetical protein